MRAVHPQDCQSAHQIEEMASAMFGHVLPFEGISHVTALWAGPGNELITIAIGEHAPRSAYDRFALNLSRARADAILITGKILRDEPTLRYDFPSEAFAEWRRIYAKRDASPRLIVLTSGQGLDPNHPAFSGWPKPMIVTSPDASLPNLSSYVEVVRLEHLTIDSALQYLQREQTFSLLSVEAGPRTTRALYRAPIRIDEMLLSIYRGLTLSFQARAASLISETELLEKMIPVASPFVADREWTFQRYRRRQKYE